MPRNVSVSGWDIGGANIKVARLDRRPGQPDAWRTASTPLAVWRESAQLAAVLADLGTQLDLTSTEALALTMTAELADVFKTKRDGVHFVCQAVAQTFPDTPVLLLDLATRGWSPLTEAATRPLDFAANNWMASSLFLAKRHPDAILVDIGSTTTDIIPLRQGRVAARGLTDTARLSTGELVYTGILRSNPNTLASSAPINGQPCRLAAELFALMADVHLLLGHITPADYSCSTADGQGVTPAEAATRLARTVCADTETLPPAQILNLAAYLHERQLQRISEALFQVLSAWDGPAHPPLLAAGSGAFLVPNLGRRLNLPVLNALENTPGPEDASAAEVLPALAAASLLADHLQEIPPC